MVTLNFTVFVNHYQLIKEYTFEEKLFELIALRIVGFMDRDEIEELKKTEFFRRFGDHEIIEIIGIE